MSRKIQVIFSFGLLFNHANCFLQEQISELTVQNSELRMAVATQAEVTMSDECQKEDKDTSKRNDLVNMFFSIARKGISIYIVTYSAMYDRLFINGVNQF